MDDIHKIVERKLLIVNDRNLIKSIIDHPQDNQSEIIMGLQPKESPEIEFLIRALINETSRTEAIMNILENKGLIVSKEQIESDAQSIAKNIYDQRRDLLISVLNLERHGR